MLNASPDRETLKMLNYKPQLTKQAKLNTEIKTEDRIKTQINKIFVWLIMRR